jgi:transcriptional regulator with XRE-family HTH domain
MPKTTKLAPPSSLQSALTSELLGQYVRARRKQLGLTIEDAAAFCGVAKDTLMKLEHGRTKVQLGTTLQICKGLGIQLTVNSGTNEDENNVWI